MNDIVLIPESIEQSWEYNILGAKYLYKVSWSRERNCYTLSRRFKPLGRRIEYNFWGRQLDVENFIQLNDGMFDPSPYARPVMKFDKILKVQDVITKDAKSNMFPE